MDLNATDYFPYLETNGENVLESEEEDPRILATFYVIYKVGEYHHFS